MAEPNQYKRYAGLALDPIHVGTGEFQLGRVDNLIVREPGSRIPKIPGTSIAGVTRAYAAMREEVPGKGTRYLYTEGDGVRSCAGKGGDNGDDHCGQANCPVCVGFGFSRGGGKSSFQGLAAFTDARILLFPVASGMETWWATCPQALLDAGAIDESERARLAKLVCSGDEYKVVAAEARGKLRLGWLSLGQANEKKPPSLALPPGLKAAAAVERMVVIADNLFSAVVNDNLEVRTSVSIDPATGAAKKGALFTAEAIPRTTVFWFEARVEDPKFFRIGGKPLAVEGLEGKIETALKDMETMGVGGLNTRGFGRLRVETW